MRPVHEGEGFKSPRSWIVEKRVDVHGVEVGQRHPTQDMHVRLSRYVRTKK